MNPLLYPLLSIPIPGLYPFSPCHLLGFISLDDDDDDDDYDDDDDDDDDNNDDNDYKHTRKRITMYKRMTGTLK